MKMTFICTALSIVSIRLMEAATLYTGADLASITSGSISDYQRSPQNHVAAKFTLTETSSEVKAVSFYGFYSGGGTSPITVTTDIFDVVIFSDSGNGPGSVIGSAQTSLIAPRDTTGSFILGHDIFRYELDLSSTIALLPDDYWIAISRNNPTAPAGTGSTWVWAGDHTSVPTLQSQGASQFVFSGTDNASPAFTLEDTPFAVPEPHSFMLTVMAAACLAGRKR